MVKTQLAATLAAFVLLSGPAFAQNMRPMHCPMRSSRGLQWSHWRPVPAVPMLLPLAEMRSYTLHLSNQQVSRLAIWRNDHMHMAIVDIHKMWRDKQALRRAILKGQAANRIGTLTARLSADRADLLQMKVAQAEMVHNTLSAGQWRRLMTIIRHRSMMWGNRRHQH